MDFGVRPQPKMLWGEDIGPETDVDNPEVPPRDSRPESSQGDVVDVSSDSEDEEWKFVKGATKSDEKNQVDDRLHDNKSQLNPNASEFYPGIEKFNPLDKDDFIAASPGVCQVADNNMDDLDMPSETEFKHDISVRACDLDPAVDMEDYAVVEPQSNENRYDDQVKVDGVSLILTPQATNIEKVVDNIETNPFADDMKPSTTGMDRVDFVQNYFGKSDLEFNFGSTTPHQNEPKILISPDAANDFLTPSPQPNNIDSYKPDESEKERNQLEIKEPESPAVSDSFSNGIEPEEHHNDIDDFPLDKSAEIGNPLDKPTVFAVKSDHVDTENDTFEAKSEKDSGLSASDTASDALPDTNDLSDLKGNLNFTQEGNHLSSEDGSSDEDAPNVEKRCSGTNLELGKINDDNITSKEPVINNFVEEVLSDISQGDSENKEDRPIVGLDEFHFDSTVSSVPDNTSWSKDHVDEPGLNHVDEFIKENKADIHSFCIDKDSAFIGETEEKECLELFNEEKVLDLGVKPPQVDSGSVQENVNNTNSIEMEGDKTGEIAIEDKDVFCSGEVPCDEIISPVVKGLSNEFATGVHISDKENINAAPAEVISPVLASLCDEGVIQVIESDLVTIHGVPEKSGSPQEDIVDDVLVKEVRYPENVINEITTKADVIPNDDRYDSSFDEKRNHSDEIELADTIGPNSFSFSQPYEIEEMSSNFRKTMVNDIMSTSMHECLDPGWSAELRESANNKHDVHLTNDNLEDNSSTVCAETLPNGVNHLESTPGIMSFPNNLDSKEKETSVYETESAIVESHEVPVSSEPDLVFVEQICPTVEVHSDEASPVINKENGGFELGPAANIAGVAAVLGGAGAVAVAMSDQKEAESKEGGKSAKPPVKAPSAKKPTAPATSKPPVSKSAPKVATTKTTTTAAKPKVPAAPKSSTSSVNKVKTLTSKPALTSTKPIGAAASTKPTTKTTVAPLSRVPPKSSTTTKTLTSAATKPAARPASAPVKTTTTAKPAAPAKMSLSSPRAAPPAIKRNPPSTARPLLSSTKTLSNTESKALPKSGPLKTALPSTKPSTLKTTSTIGAKPPSKLGVSAVAANKLKATSPTKPAPIKAKAPLTVSKRPTSATTKKTSTVLDKNAKNTVKSVTKESVQKEIIGNENKISEAAAVTTTNGHHIENGNITPLEEIPTHII